MVKDIHDWVKKVEAARPAMILMAMQMQQPNVVVELHAKLKRLCRAIPFVATFTYENGAKTSIFFQLMSDQTDSDVVITHMTTLPESSCRYGFGSKTVQALLAWSKENNLHEIRATQVGDSASQGFWEKNGFVKCLYPDPLCKDYVYKW